MALKSGGKWLSAPVVRALSHVTLTQLRPGATITTGRARPRSVRMSTGVDGIEIYVSASVGISLYPADGDDPGTLLKHADVAMYSVKDAGRDGYARYSVGGNTALEQISAAGRLRKSVESGRGLVLHYQPLMNLETAEVVGRWTVKSTRRTARAAARRIRRLGSSAP